MSRMSCLGCSYERNNGDFDNNLSTTAGFEDPKAQQIRLMIDAFPPDVRNQIRKKTSEYGYGHPYFMKVINRYDRMLKHH